MIASRTWVEISRGQLAANYRSIQAAVGAGIALAPVVKANAYGHGAVEISRALVAEGARWLAVNCVAEGVLLRDAGIDCRVLVMGGVLPFEREAASGARLTPVVHSLDELRELDAAQFPGAVHLMVDTGITRLGVQAGTGEIAQAVRAVRFLRVEGLMSHFASAEMFPASQTEAQIARFTAIREAGFTPEIAHFSSTNGVAYGWRGAWLSLVRPGIALYGYIPPGSGDNVPPAILAVRPVLTWRARLLAIKEIPEGTLIGYGGSFRAPGPMRIGVIAAGYADGIPHRLSNRGYVIAAGRLVPILGAVSMDLTTVDLTVAPALQVGASVTILGNEGDVRIDAQEIAQWAGEISYSVLCGIGNRVERIYV